MIEKQPHIICVGMETSGALRRRFQAKGYETYSVDLLPAEDGGEETRYTDDGMLTLGQHQVGDVFAELDNMAANDLWPSAAIFHIDCTYLTCSAEWAYKDPDFDRYPGVGYHQRVKPDTLVGAARRAARAAAMDQFRRICALKIEVKVIENPIGALSRIKKPTQVIQPYEFGDDASKATCLWFLDRDNNHLPPMRIDPAKRVPGRLVMHGGKMVERWANQTDGGQNSLSPGDDRWKDRARTYPGIADAITEHVHGLLNGSANPANRLI